MTSKKQRRAYEKRRFEQWQQRRSEKYVRNQKLMRVGAVVASAAAVVAILGFAGWKLFAPDSSLDAAAEAAKDAAKTVTAAEEIPADPNNPCPEASTTTSAKEANLSKPEPTDGDRAVSTLKLGTTCGDVLIELDGTKAPQATAVMRQLAFNKFYDDTPCHRLTTSSIFVLQCGDPTRTGTGDAGYSFGPIENAPEDDLYPAGTIAMARTSNNGESMGSQFFIVWEDSNIPSDAAGGYTVVGRVTEGLDVITKIAEGGASPEGDGAPVRGINIVSSELV